MEVKKHVILLLDVMGYCEHIRPMTIEEENRYLRKIHNLMVDLSSFITKRNMFVDSRQDSRFPLNLSRWKWCVFSDNILFFASYENDVDADNLWGNLLYGLSEFYMQYEWNDLFLRGALTKGNLYYDEKLHFIFGNGLVHAYDLESNNAKYPRIFIDSELKPSPILVGHDKDKDGDWYFNYLDLFYAHFYYEKSIDSQKYFLSCLAKHQNNIIQAIKSYGAIDKLAEKYNWLANFHNEFCYKRGFEEFLI